MIRGWNTEKLCEFSAERAMQWKFATPASPHQKGCAEALVKSCELQTSPKENYWRTGINAL